MSLSFLRDKLRASIMSKLSKGNKYTLSAFIPFISCKAHTDKDVQCSSLKERDTEQPFSHPQWGGRAAWKFLLEKCHRKWNAGECLALNHKWCFERPQSLRPVLLVENSTWKLMGCCEIQPRNWEEPRAINRPFTEMCSAPVDAMYRLPGYSHPSLPSVSWASDNYDRI